MTTQKRDDEKGQVAVGAGIFTVVLAVADIFYHNMHALLTSWLVAPFIIVHAALIVCWVIAILNFTDPNYDKFRKYVIYIAIAGLVLVLGHRSGWLEQKQVLIDSQTEQAKP